MAYKKPILQVAMEEHGWSEYKGETLPESANPLIDKTEMFKYPGGWSKAYYKGNVKTTDQWIVVTNNGGFYKVDALFMVWEKTGRALACWSQKHMKKTVIAFFQDTNPERDPDYQT